MNTLMSAEIPASGTKRSSDARSAVIRHPKTTTATTTLFPKQATAGRETAHSPARWAMKN